MKKQNILLSLFLILILMSCGKTTSDLKFSVNDSSKSFLDPSQPVTFTQIKSTILIPYCLSCHSSVGTESNLKKWITPGNPQGSSFFTTVENGSMPKNHAPLDTSKLELIKLYIEQMAPVPTSPVTPTPTPIVSGITYAQIKAAVLTPYRCVNCHSVGTESQLVKWINTTSPERSAFYTTIKSGSMPPSGAEVSVDNQALVLQYLKDFAAR